MEVCVVGLNHTTTPVEIRERVAISRSRSQEALSALSHYLPQGVILSTCNRTEVYAVGNSGGQTHQAIISFLNARANIADADLLPYLYIYRDEAAIRHLFCVAAGLDSMIAGEYEILGQVRQALEDMEKAQMANLPLRNLFQHAVGTGRRVREQTAISRNALSVSSVAVDLATRVVSDLTKCKILVIGAGEAGKLVAKAVRERGASQITVISRSRERAAALATTLGGRAMALSQLKEELSSADVVISCTGAPHFVLKCTTVEETMHSRPERPLVLVDIAVPRDVETEAGQIENVFLYDIDDLVEISEWNRKQREMEVEKAMEIVEAETKRFASWWQSLEVKPTISALVRKGEKIRQKQLRLALKRLGELSDEDQAGLEIMTKAIVQKLLHEPIQCLKSNAHNKEDYARVVSELFRLDGDELR